MQAWSPQLRGSLPRCQRVSPPSPPLSQVSTSRPDEALSVSRAQAEAYCADQSFVLSFFLSWALLSFFCAAGSITLSCGALLFTGKFNLEIEGS